jgi:lysophospholipase L1-like esterase
MSKSSPRAKFALVGIALALVPVLLLVFEVGTRILSEHVDPLAVFVSSPQLKQDTQGVNTKGMFEFDPALTWRLRPGLRNVWWDYTTVSTNARGLRMDRELGPKKAGALRIVALGDSVTFGYRIPIARVREKPEVHEPGETYVALLEKSLKAKFPGREVEVIPLACPGYTSWQGLAWLRRDIAELKPDIVTACFGWNDVRAAGLPDRETFPMTDGQVLARKIIARSQGLLHMTSDAASKNAEGPKLERAPEPRSSPEEYTLHFEQMAAVCREHGAWFGVILPVYRDPNTPDTDPRYGSDPIEGLRMGEYRDRLRASTKAANIPALEITELTEKNWPASKPLFGERIHPNAAGHSLMAERIEAFITAEVQRITGAK